jgi:glycosyltransferase involved in cell wall biosynthesis
VSILFGHPTGSPFSHNAALAHLESGRLDSFCVPWMPSKGTLQLLNQIGPLRPLTQRLGRRHFAPLAGAPKIQGRMSEFCRLFVRAIGQGHDLLTEQANDWLMRTMAHQCRRSSVTAVHAYEDCSLWQFEEAKRLGKACIYDMPIGHFAAWERTRKALEERYSDWLNADQTPLTARRVQKTQELALADLVLAPSKFVKDTIRATGINRPIATAPYGVDIIGWQPASVRIPKDEVTFLFVGQCSLRKGVPLLVEAWRAAGLKGARLQLVGPWQLAEAKKKNLPASIGWSRSVSPQQLRGIYQNADVFVFPTNFEGRALVIGEALASGLPVLTTDASGADDLVDETCGRIIPAENYDALVESLRWFMQRREHLAALGLSARKRATRCSWAHYRRQVSDAVARFV